LLVVTNWAEYYLYGLMTEHVMAAAEDASRKGSEIEVLRWAT
jgi:hypothetical protein